jgi:hypothetical protein
MVCRYGLTEDSDEEDAVPRDGPDGPKSAAVSDEGAEAIEDGMQLSEQCTLCPLQAVMSSLRVCFSTALARQSFVRELF